MAERKLTPKQEAFCVAYLETGNASAAYRKAYDAENMQDDSVWTTACVLLKNAKVASRIVELREPIVFKAVERASVTVAEHLAKLAQLRDLAISANQFSAAITAERCRGQVAGHYIERTEHGKPGEFAHLNDDELRGDVADRVRRLGDALGRIGTPGVPGKTGSIH